MVEIAVVVVVVVGGGLDGDDRVVVVVKCHATGDRVVVARISRQSQAPSSVVIVNRVWCHERLAVLFMMDDLLASSMFSW